VKIFINRKPVVGPWGGGNKSVSLLHKKCAENFEVTTNIGDKDIDLIFCIDPRPDPSGLWYQNFLDYKNNINPNLKIIQRVGDVGSHSKPELTQLVRQTVEISDFMIFPSDWARNYIEFKGSNYCVIPNRSSKIFFNHRKEKNINSKDKIKIVTHHWSKNPKKGFDVYQGLGQFISENDTNLEFTYIGRFPDDVERKGIKIIEPQDDASLSKMLSEFDIYMTASLEEAGANHVLEGIAAGLPIVYRKNGGSIQEYCSRYGIEYDHNIQSLFSSINKVTSMYPLYKNMSMSYNENLEMSIDTYIDVIKGVMIE
jgi:hypothetical protein